MKNETQLLESTLAFWQARASRVLTEEDAREISETLYELIALLYLWYIEDHGYSSELFSHSGKAVA